MLWFRPASGCSSAGSVKKDETSCADVGSNGVGVKESRESRVPVGLGEVAVGGELDLWPVRVSHLCSGLVGMLNWLREEDLDAHRHLERGEVSDVDGGGFLSEALSRLLKLPRDFRRRRFTEGGG